MIEGEITRIGVKGLGGELPGQVHYGIQGPQGDPGVGIESVYDPGDGTFEIHTSDGNITVITLPKGNDGISITDVNAVMRDDGTTTVEIYDENSKQLAKFDIPPGTDYVLTDADKEEIAEKVEGLVVTVTGNTASHSSREIADYVKSGKNVVMKSDNDWYSFISYNEDIDCAYFIQVEAMEADRFVLAQVMGKRVVIYTMSNSGGNEEIPPSDWNAAEGEPGHILNRPFYSESVLGLVLAETTLDFSASLGTYRYPDKINIVTGGQYTVNWNSVEYVRTAGFYEGYGLVVGNEYAVGGENNGDPFSIIVPIDEVGYGAYIADHLRKPTNTLSIRGTQEVIHKIPARYLPDNIGGSGGNVDWNSVKSFGAVGDGETDDTDAIQSALDAGGIVYFPSGVYKVTRQLTTNVPCTIRMERIYPGSYNENTTELSGYDHPKADYPTNDTNMGYGARIETYATDGFGLLVTDGSSVDGLAIRAMDGFSGVVLKYDGSKGCRSYPSTSRFRHIKVDCDVSTIKPESLFDFFPYGNYGTIVEDVIIGSNHTRQFAKYGFRTSLAFWANSIRLRDIVVDVVAEYPFYINANGKQAKNWTISNVAVQAFPCQSNWLVPTHTNIAYINGLSALYISGCKLWDVNTDEGADNPTTVSGDVIYNGVISAAAFGNDGWFDSLDTVLTEQLRVANELNLAKLVTTVTTDSATGNHTVTLYDGKVTKSFMIPATALSDEQIANGITQWMVENADPKPVVGTNKLNPEECFDGTLSGGVEQASDYYWSAGYIPCQKGDTIRFYDTQTPPVARTLERYYLYDANKNALNGGSSFKPTSGAILIETDDTAYIRMIVTKTGTWGIPFADRDKCMVAINTTMGAFEPYTVTMEGGIASYIDLDAIVEKIDLTEYAKKTYVQEYAQPKGNYLTEHQSLVEYAKKTDIPTTLPASDVPSWAKASSKPTYSKSEVGLGNVDNVKQYSASNPPPYPVSSVNGKTGAVTLDAAAVGARPSSWMPSASDVGALPNTTTVPSKTETWTFTLEDGSTVTKAVYVK